MDQEGQAYSAFKLLIAAIVAMAILGILMPIIMQVMGILTKPPADATITLIDKLAAQPGTMLMTEVVTFEPGGGNLVASTLAERTALSSEQICLSLGDPPKGFPNDPDRGFTVLGSQDEGSHRIIWNGGQRQQAKVAVVCNNSAESLDGDILAYELDAECYCPPSGRCCAVVVQRV